MEGKEAKRGDWMVFLNDYGYIQVKCSECGYRVYLGEGIPDVCPKCGSVNMEDE